MYVQAPILSSFEDTRRHKEPERDSYDKIYVLILRFWQLGYIQQQIVSSGRNLTSHPVKVSLSWTVSPNSCAAALIGTDDGQFREDEVGASLSTFSDGLQGSPKWLSRSTKDIDRLYEFWVPPLLSINGS
jgi:hypothetical protein